MSPPTTVFYPIRDERCSLDHPLGDAMKSSSVARTPERLVEVVRGDDPEVAAKLRIEERELVAGGLN